MSSRCVTYRLIVQGDGLLGITVTGTTGFTVQRRDLPSHAAAAQALQDLRVILTAQNLHLVQAGGAALA